MKTNGIFCDECRKAGVREGGYLLDRADILGGLSIMIVKAEDAFDPDAFDIHLCGKGCLMSYLNDELDALAGINREKKSPPQAALYEERERMRIIRGDAA